MPIDSAVATGAFTLGGVALGAVLEWARSALAARQAAADERDQLFAGLGTACTSLLMQARIIRTLDRPGMKLKQLTHGMMEGEARHPVVVSQGLAVAVRQMMASAAANGLSHLSPVSMVDRINRDLLPIMSEIAVLAIRLSMTGDEGLKGATTRVTDAAGGLLSGITEKEPGYLNLEAEMNAALGQMRRARDAVAAPLWRRRRARRAIFADAKGAAAVPAVQRAKS
jgi:hypothetical protein